MADEQVGNNNYLTMTPGSAVAGQLQNILTQKRLEARQAMLDQIHAKDIESQIRDRDENTRANSEFRAANAENRKAQEVQRRAGLYSPDMPMDPNSEDYKYIQKEAPSLLNPATPETPQFDYEGQAPIPAAGPTFRGLPVQIEASRKAKIQSDAMAALNSPDFAKKSPTERAAIFRMATGSEPSADIIEGRKEPHSQGYTEYQDYLASKPPKPLSFNDYMTMDANRKKPNVPVERPSWAGNTPDGKPVFMMNKVDGKGLPVLMTADGVRYTGPINKPPTGAGGSKANITPAEAIKYAQFKAKAADTPGLLYGTNKAKEEDRNRFFNLENDIYARFPVEVSSLAKDILANESPETPNEEVVKHALTSGSITEPEVPMLYMLLQTVRGS